MFGYVRPQKSELLVREYEEYRAVYCSLCRRLGKSYGAAARLTLSYDCTFYAMLLLALDLGCTGYRTGRCVVNPLKKCTFCVHGEEQFTAASALSVLMTYQKIRDDIQDSGAFGKLRGYLLLPLAACARRKAARDFPRLEQIVSDAMEQQRKVESGPFSGIDRCAEPTAFMLQGVFEWSAGSDESSDSPKFRVLRQLGYFLGRWVYLMDAADDMEKDMESGAFNPFVRQFHLNGSSSREEIDKVKAYANQTLNATLSRMLAAFYLLDTKHFGPILLNIVSKGLPEIQKEILFKKEKMNVGSL